MTMPMVPSRHLFVLSTFHTLLHNNFNDAFRILLKLPRWTSAILRDLSAAFDAVDWTDYKSGSDS
ncbi:hypothetical protein EYF80_040244 [Liparis tanakae]|uniref:Uncharacterized protein n=1 Tax=Liparis tanakae TaxID=230148 RepID=A0A4Z2G7T5_9TELE|nr:hypothetical protein EYF80_040244 [Liparis tanakae]